MGCVAGWERICRVSSARVKQPTSHSKPVTVLVTGESYQMSATAREIYTNAPLALVALEVKFPSEAATEPLAVHVQKAFRQRLKDPDDWVIESTQVQQVEVSFSPPAQNIRSLNVPRLLKRDRSTAVSFPPGSLTVETTRYRGYEGFRELLGDVFAASEELLSPDGIARMGLRYIDEIRVPDGVDEPGTWGQWVKVSLLSPSLPLELVEKPRIGSWTAAAQYHFGDDRFLVLRYGPQPGPVVNSLTTTLRRPSLPPDSSVFVLDFDSSWQPAGLPAFKSAELLEICDQLHTPASASFESFLTEQLRNVFRGSK